jgi:hypothetical protein
LNEHTPKIRCAGKSVDPALIFGIDSKLFRHGDTLPLSEHPPATQGTGTEPHHDEVETVTLLRGAPTPAAHAHVHDTDSCDHPHHPHLHSLPEESTTAHATPALPPLLDEPTLSAALQRLPKESVYRVKGFICLTHSPTGTGTSSPSPITDIDTSTGTGTAAIADSEGKRQQAEWWILNWAFGRWELVPVPTSPFAEDEDEERRGVVRLTMMGERGEVRRNAKRLAETLGAEVVD